MTDQVKDHLIYRDNEYCIHAQPLEQYLEELPGRLFFQPPATACWRGYVSKWKIENDRLYLVDLSVFINDYWQEGIDMLFPGQEKVFAGWFSGEILLPVKNAMWMNLSLEKQLTLKFNKGKLESPFPSI